MVLYDAIIIGAGPGGLVCATNLVKSGYKVKVFERNFFYGGTSHIFNRQGYYFPMGPLGFSSPTEVQQLLLELGITAKIEFTKHSYQLVSPSFDMIYSQPLQILEAELKKLYKEEKKGIETFFTLLKKIVKAEEHVHEWYLFYNIDKMRKSESDESNINYKEDFRVLNEYSQISAQIILDKYISNEHLKRFLGSLGTDKPKMSMRLLAVMWNLMAEKGIWRPAGGIHGIMDRLHEKLIQYGREEMLSTPIKEILIDNGQAIGVKTQNNLIIKAHWIVCNADYKTTFLKLINSYNIPADFLEKVKSMKYFGSEFCVYLGIDPSRINLSKIRAQHIFYRKVIKPTDEINLEDFDNREIEICFWSEDDPSLAPLGKISMLIRVSFPYEFFCKWKTDEGKRGEGYREYKKQLALKLVSTAENIVPGLKSSIEVMETASPLTYEEFGQRFQGSIAGWSWAFDQKLDFGKKLLIETPIHNLLMVGLYASTELFLGGFPTAMYTGYWASEIIRQNMEDSKS